jgi:hypothetical protein
MESPSRYGGVAAVLVFGIGLLATGRTWAGIGVLFLGGVVMAIMLAPNAAAKLLFLSIAAVMLGGVLTFWAVSDEITGKAVYHEPIPFRKRWTSEPVTRDGSPAKFRAAVNYLWAGSALCATAAIVAFRFARKLDYADDF